MKIQEADAKSLLVAQGLPVPPWSVARSPAEARAWLDAERANLVTVSGCAADLDLSTQAGYLATTLSRYLEVGVYYTDALTVHANALRAAAKHGDRFGEAAARLGLGGPCFHLGRFDEAADFVVVP